tara:strand:- start:52 stop:378 length:327 start_codon:yes stop_codon:yes gene_type:complete
MSIKKADLEKQVRLLNSITEGNYSLGWAYGGVRVERADGSIDVTERGSKQAVYAMLRGMVHVALQRRDAVRDTLIGLEADLIRSSDFETETISAILGLARDQSHGSFE